MCDRKADFFGNVDGRQQGPFLVARWAGAALFTRVGDEHLVVAVWATNSGKTFLQISALEKGCNRPLDDRTPVAVLGLKSLVVDLLESVKMLVDQAPQIGGPRIAWPVENWRFGTRHSHEKNAISSPRSAIARHRASPSIPSVADCPMAPM